VSSAVFFAMDASDLYDGLEHSIAAPNTLAPLRNAPADSSGPARPMTSVAGAGYQSRATTGAAGGGVGGLAAVSRASIPPFKPSADNGPASLAKGMEERVHALLEASTASAAKGDLVLALERAKEAGRRERALSKFREGSGLSDAINSDLTFAVCFNLAHTVSLLRIFLRMARAPRRLACSVRACWRRAAYLPLPLSMLTCILFLPPFHSSM
jgi:hypothetical protein